MLCYSHMYDRLPNIEKRELLKIKNVPQMGFESYKMLGGAKEAREATKSSFMDGEIVNPNLDYPELDIAKLAEDTRRLQEMLSLAEEFEWDERMAIWNSAAYRIAEMYLLKSAAYLHDTVKTGDESQIEAAAKEYQRLNEQLFGELSPSLERAILGEAFSQIKAKKLTLSSQALLDDLRSGFSVRAGGEEAQIRPLNVASEERLPVVDQEALNRLKKILEQEFPEVFTVVDDYYEHIIKQKEDGSQVFEVQDMSAIFKKLCEGMGIDVVDDEDGTNLSWDIEKSAIVVGGRRPVIKKRATMYAKAMHEYAIHGGRAIKGSNSALALLGTGLYTELEDENNFDYLTFEEGLAAMAEFAVEGDKAKWDPVDMEKSLAIALAYRGYDFRQTYETLWRLRCLLLVKDGKDFEEESMQRAKRNTYGAVERVFRGTPTQLLRHNQDGSVRVLTYNKDLVYLSGKILALDFLKSADEDMIRLSLQGKFDPTNPKHLALAQKHLSHPDSTD